jgi:hypothetical protein
LEIGELLPRATIDSRLAPVPIEIDGDAVGNCPDADRCQVDLLASLLALLTEHVSVFLEEQLEALSQ